MLNLSSQLLIGGMLGGFVGLVMALPLAASMDRTLWRLQLLGALNWTPTWYRPGGKSPKAIARALVAALR